MSQRPPVHEVDILGDPYLVERIELPDDDEGPVVASLVQRRPGHGPATRAATGTATGTATGAATGAATGRAVLHLHGFCDYFFQTTAADFWTDRGYTFYALDLRKYGRSLLAHQTPNFVTDLREHFTEIDAALERIRARDGHDHVVVTAHSTGGLVGALWAHERRPRLAGMVLNSPWLDLHGSFFLRTVGTVALDRLGARRPYHVVPRAVSGLYGQSLHKDHRGEWEFNLEWKPIESYPVRAGWLRAVRRAHAQVHRGIDVGAPVLVLTSGTSSSPKQWTDAVDQHDIVLDVEQMRQWAHKLADHVTLARVDGARHDVTLSAEPVRSRAFAEVARWLEAYVDGVTAGQRASG